MALPRAYIVIGVPGAGKSTAVNELVPVLSSKWRVMRLDDDIGPTFACYPGRAWADIRGFHPFFGGWGAGYYLARGQDVLMEGHLLYREERHRLERSIRDVCQTPFNLKVVCISETRDEIIRRRKADTGWEPNLTEKEREEWANGLTANDVPPPDVYDVEIQANARDPISVAEELLNVLGIQGPDLKRPLRPQKP